MCKKVYALFRCADYHEQISASRNRFKLIRDCKVFQDGGFCRKWQRVHSREEGEPDEDCPECRWMNPQDLRAWRAASGAAVVHPGAGQGYDKKTLASKQVIRASSSIFASCRVAGD